MPQRGAGAAAGRRRRSARAPRPGGRAWRPPSRRAGPWSGRPPGSGCTAVSKSMTPLSTIAGQRRRARRRRPSVNADLEPVLGEAERPPQPARLLDVTPVSLGDLERGEDRLLAEDRALELVAGRWGRRRRQVPSSAARRRRGSASRCSSSATLQLDLLDPRDVVQLDPALLAGVGDDQRAAAEQPVDRRRSRSRRR